MQWILIDAEHGAIGDTEMHNMIPAIAGTGAAPIVRVPAPELAFFKRALDAGAFGVMVPMVETKVGNRIVNPTHHAPRVLPWKVVHRNKPKL
jgi:4-hydroxy-2-oxoheptanedioate aldolase